ncbi:probable cytochrome P450 4p3 [Drosophila albomicans]|uniref:Probable cytochrome P450 4p3 n=1 Tax=Drosophila albomicans TaxID=7291 RepID=A0A6P8WQL0_DROAB|nr:probable cytochrome P450 4p3 [Drosophila albomicans]
MWIFIAILIGLLSVYAFRLRKDYVLLALCRRFKTIDGGPLEKTVATGKGTTIFGNTFDTLGMTSEQLFYYSRDYATELKRSYIQYVFGFPIYNIIDADDAELILNDNNLITKGDMYRFLQPFLKTGLLTSTGQYWHGRRKLLTPAFHFKILEQFLDVFKQESVKVIDLIQNMLDATDGPCQINLNDIIPRFTLNSICETALGVKLDDCSNGDEYRSNITIAEHSFIKRVINPLMSSDALYNRYGDGVKDIPTLNKLHSFSSSIIEKRRQNFNEENLKEIDDIESRYLNTKQRYAMLDTMLMAEKEGLIDHAGICEEVDTFMFEGFDTTSMNLILTLAYLANHPQWQQRCFEEISELIPSKDLSEVDNRTLSQMKYLECAIKETQRLCPSVPGMMRECHEETKLANNLIMPKGTQIIVHIFDIHRNPQYFENPDEWIPSRFLPENSEHRHPFAFIPFSAGRRNCIGQKFAMLEVKTLLVHILRNFEILPVSNPREFKFLAGILIRTKSDVFIKIVKRQAEYTVNSI